MAGTSQLACAYLDSSTDHEAHFPGPDLGRGDEVALTEGRGLEERCYYAHKSCYLRRVLRLLVNRITTNSGGLGSVLFAMFADSLDSSLA